MRTIPTPPQPPRQPQPLGMRQPYMIRMPNFRQHAVLRQPFIGPIEFGLRNPQFAGLFPQPRMPIISPQPIIPRNTYPTQRMGYQLGQRMPARSQPRMPGGLGMRLPQRGMRLPQRQLSNRMPRMRQPRIAMPRMPCPRQPRIPAPRMPAHVSPEIIDLRSEDGGSLPASEEASIEALEDLEGGSLLGLGGE